jgi:hypothetical protein
MWLVYAREKKHNRTKWSRVTCLAHPLTAAQSLISQALKDSQSHRCNTPGVTVATIIHLQFLYNVSLVVAIV